MSLWSKMFGEKDVSSSVGVCDICQHAITVGDGHLLSTRQVVMAEAYWAFAFTQQWTYLKQFDPDGRTLPTHIMQQAGQDSGWLVCPSCIRLFQIEENATRAACQQWWRDRKFLPSGAGSVSPKDVAPTAMKAWTNSFGSNPDGMGLEPSEVTISGIEKVYPFMGQLVRREAKRVFRNAPSVPAERSQPQSATKRCRSRPKARTLKMSPNSQRAT